MLFSFSPGLYILDVDKCSDGSHDCHPNATCWGDTAGNFTCTCQAGFTGNGRQCYGKLIRKCTYLTNSFQVAVRLFSNRSQMTSKCGKKEEVVHEPQASAHVSPMFLPHFDVLCNLLLNKPTAAWNLFVLYNDQHRKKTNTNTCLAPFDCLSICASLGIFLVPNATFRLSFFFILLVYSFFENFFTVFSCSKQNNGENILQNNEALVAMTHDGNCCEDFL